MGYLVEKQVASGFYYHYMNNFESWITKENKMSEYDATKTAIELSNKDKGTYRVRDIYNGKIIFKITTQ